MPTQRPRGRSDSCTLFKTWVCFQTLRHALEPTKLAYMPRAQFRQDGASGRAAYFPLAQVLHDVAPFCEYVPGLQLRQLVAPFSEYLPAVHVLQVVLPVLEPVTRVT